MRPLSLSRISSPALRASRVAIAAGTLAGLATLGACADSVVKSVTAPSQGPRNGSSVTSTVQSARFATVCVSGYAGTYTFSNSNYTAAGGVGAVTVFTPSAVATTYTITAGGPCVDVIFRQAGNPILPDGPSFAQVNYVSGPGVLNDISCVNDIGAIPALPVGQPTGTPCGKLYPSVRVEANFAHGMVITYDFSAPVVTAVPIFVIGDVEAHGLGANVNWWGAQWWKNNDMSGIVTPGAAGGSFKGYAEIAGTCGQPWSSRVGNSPPPPDVLPDPLYILVTKDVIKSGPNLGGTILQILRVSSDGGYSSNPGHRGNGTVLEVVCTAP